MLATLEKGAAAQHTLDIMLSTTAAFANYGGGSAVASGASRSFRDPEIKDRAASGRARPLAARDPGSGVEGAVELAEPGLPHTCRQRVTNTHVAPPSPPL